MYCDHLMSWDFAGEEAYSAIWDLPIPLLWSKLWFRDKETACIPAIFRNQKEKSFVCTKTIEDPVSGGSQGYLAVEKVVEVGIKHVIYEEVL